MPAGIANPRQPGASKNPQKNKAASGWKFGRVSENTLPNTRKTINNAPTTIKGSQRVFTAGNIHQNRIQRETKYCQAPDFQKSPGVIPRKVNPHILMTCLQSCHRYLADVSPLDQFLSPDATSLKVCGVTRREDALELVRHGVDAIGVNFWPPSKRHLAPRDAAWLGEISGRILRVGVFVNQPIDEALELWRAGLIDVIQLHGDEGPAHREALISAGAPFFQAVAITADGKPATAMPHGAAAILLDAHAPGIYGGTGQVIDWTAARALGDALPDLPVILAGGITPENAAAAAAAVRPAALDVASGVESAPGVKDMGKITRLLAAIRD